MPLPCPLPRPGAGWASGRTCPSGVSWGRGVRVWSPLPPAVGLGGPVQAGQAMVILYQQPQRSRPRCLGVGGRLGHLRPIEPPPYCFPPPIKLPIECLCLSVLSVPCIGFALSFVWFLSLAKCPPKCPRGTFQVSPESIDRAKRCRVDAVPCRIVDRGDVCAVLKCPPPDVPPPRLVAWIFDQPPRIPHPRELG